VDLPTYTNIWRIEKRLYKLYDFRLPMPLPISWIAVFCGITVPYVAALAVIGVPFNHNLLWLYILPPGVLTWLTTRPVLENKRLPELLVSQLRYIGEPRTWCRLKPLSEKDGTRVYARVWHRAPTVAAEAAERSMALAQAARAAGDRAPALPGRAGPGGIPAPDRAPGAGRKAWRGGLDRPSPTPLTQRPAQGPAAWPHAGLSAGQIRAGARGVQARGVQARGVQARGVQVRDGARAGTGPVRAGAEPAGPYRSGSGWARPGRPEPAAGSGGLPEARRPAIPGRVLRDPAEAGPAPRDPLPITPPAIEVSHETQGTQGPSAVPLWGRPSSRRSGPGAPASRAVPRGRPPHAVPTAPARQDAPAPSAPDVSPASAGDVPAPSAPDVRPASTQNVTPATAQDAPATAIPVVPEQPLVPEQPRRPVPSIERALSGPAADRIDSWQRRVRVVPGGEGPGKRDRETLDRDRARLPLAGPRRIVFLGCTSGAGQTVTALMTGQLLAALRGVPVAAIDLNPGYGSLIGQARTAPALTVAAFLAGAVPPGHPGPAASAGGPTGARFDVITSGADPASAASAAAGGRDYPRLAERAGQYYPLTMLDPGAATVTRVMGIADQLVVVAPASEDAPRSLAMTQEWLGASGHGDLAARAVTVVNGVSKASMGDVERAEAVARGHCRAIVRIPWEDVLADGAPGVSALRPQARHAYTALAGVLVAGLAAVPVPRKVLH